MSRLNTLVLAEILFPDLEKERIIIRSLPRNLNEQRFYAPIRKRKDETYNNLNMSQNKNYQRRRIK